MKTQNRISRQAAGLATDIVYGLGVPALSWWRALTYPLASQRKARQRTMNGLEPRSLSVNVTNVCNAKCVFCAYPKADALPDRVRASMPMDLFLKVVAEGRSKGMTSCDLTPVVGDPLIDPTILAKIRHLKESGFTEILLTTNAILLHRMVRDLYESGLTHAFISLPSCEREDYKEIYGVDSWPIVAKGLKEFLAMAAEKGALHVRLRFRNALRPSAIMNSDGFQTVVAPYLGPHVSVNFCGGFDNWGGSIKKEDMRGVMRMKRAPLKIRVPCTGLTNYKILEDGKVRLCGCRFREDERDDLMVGDVNRQTISEIAASDRVKAIVEGFYHNQVPKCCRECSFYRPITEN